MRRIINIMYLGLVIDMFRIKQIGMVAMLGLALLLVTAAVYTQSAQAFGRCCGDNGVNPGGPMVPPFKGPILITCIVGKGCIERTV